MHPQELLFLIFKKSSAGLVILNHTKIMNFQAFHRKVFFGKVQRTFVGHATPNGGRFDGDLRIGTIRKESPKKNRAKKLLVEYVATVLLSKVVVFFLKDVSGYRVGPKQLAPSLQDSGDTVGRNRANHPICRKPFT